ncbi:DinB family protein [Massilia sp. TSP1-1-2]|uniref:DinB family protein n=1 Tax=Massilia sp. TSP1-1-2 TaxID=2804649 RepID=UPI003CE91E9C
MSERALFGLLAEYNEAMNTKLYQAAGQLSAEQLNEDRGAFFGSLSGTMNHIVAGDTIWLQRFAGHPARFAALQPVLAMAAPAGLTAIYSRDLATLSVQRGKLDAIIRQWVAGLADADLQHVLQYKNTKGVPAQKRFSSLVLHFFNHQTHHRGQASTLLSQAGIDLGMTDLLAWIPNEY